MISLWVGSIVGYVVFKLFIRMITKNNPLLGLYISLSSCAVLTGVLAILAFDYSCIFGSAAVGAYMFIRGFSIVFGHFPNELIIFESY